MIHRIRPTVLLSALLALGVFAPAAAQTRLGTLQFAPCTIEPPGSTRSYSAGCTTLEVAEHPELPDARRLALRLVLIESEASDAPADPVVLLAGGPGQSAVDAWTGAEAGFADIVRRRHVLLLDQRGTGQSNPLPCAMDEWMVAPREHWKPLARASAQRCAAELSQRADLRHYTTVDAVRDLESLRQALGAPQLNLYGGSYGTRVALDYLRRHPEGVRTLILDGVVPPQRVLGQDHAANLDAGLELIFSACRADTACAQRYGDPAATLANLGTRLAEHPLQVALADPYSNQPRSERLDDTTLLSVLRFMAYQPEFASLLPLLIDEAWEGRPQPLVAQGLMVFRRLGDQLMHGMELSVICSEDADLMQAGPEQAATRMGTVMQELFAEQCAVWPHKSRPADFHQPVRADRPVLLLSGAWDPVTPPAFADEAMVGLNQARHVVVAGQGHGVLDSGCLPRRVAEFLDAPDPAALDLSCLDGMQPPAFFTGYHGTEP